MATIDNLDLDVYRSYAARMTLLAEFNQQLRVKEADRVTSDVTIVAHSPIYTELELTMGLTSRPKPYATFTLPDSFSEARRDSFTTYCVCPSIGNLEDQNRCKELIDGTVCQSSQDQAEQATLSNLMGEMGKINGWLSHILGRIGQFRQG